MNRSSLDGRPSEMLQRLTDLRRKVRDPSEEASKHLSDDIIVTQGVPFFIGSFVSISTVLSSLSYFLAKNQRVQVKNLMVYTPANITRVNLVMGLPKF